MRRERNQYIFASELTKRNRSHRFRNAVLILLPILIVSLWVLNITVSRRVKLEELKLTVLNLPDDLESYSILHLSDLHGARFGEEQKAVAAALDFYKLTSDDLIIVYDDITIPTGRMRIRMRGSDGGHNGMKNIIYLSGSDQFPRIKLGVGHKPEKWDLADWVLSRFSEDEYKLLSETAEKAAHAAELIISGQTDKAMNLYNG